MKINIVTDDNICLGNLEKTENQNENIMFATFAFENCFKQILLDNRPSKKAEHFFIVIRALTKAINSNKTDKDIEDKISQSVLHYYGLNFLAVATPKTMTAPLWDWLREEF